jgi:hypothetical protein
MPAIRPRVKDALIFYLFAYSSDYLAQRPAFHASSSFYATRLGALTNNG